MLPLTYLQILLRLALAAIFGGVLGLEREVRRRPAGFRTYTLVCVGSAIAMMTNQFLNEHLASDASRLGAQVISGIGFLGAGTILITGRNQVKGLTTAAGLWACACMGLAIGVGFYALALMGCALIFTVLSLLTRLDNRLVQTSSSMTIYIELEQGATMGPLLRALREHNMRISELSNASGVAQTVALTGTLSLPRKMEHAVVLETLAELPGVAFAEEL